MTDREKLIEPVKDSLKKNIGKSCNLAENIADYLLANGISVPRHHPNIIWRKYTAEDLKRDTLNEALRNLQEDGLI